MKTAAVYCRYSTDRQDASSLEDQERKCRAFAVSKGFTVVAVYGDAAVSGSHTQRAQLQKMLTDAKTLKLSAVIVDDLSRLSRDLIDTGNIVRSLAAKRISVLDVKTGSDSRDESSESLRFIEGFVGGEYIKAIRRQTHRGLEGRAMGGHATGGKAYGYTTTSSTTATDRRQVVIDEVEAAVVQRIFTMAADGQSSRAIANQLNLENVPAPHDGGKGHKGNRGWGHTTIRAMLPSRRYLGEVRWNTTKWTKNHDTGTRQPEPRPESEHVVKHCPDLSIISQELWNRVQATIPPKRARKGGSVTRAPYPLSGLLLCADCGGSFGAISRVKDGEKVYRTLGCVTHKSRGNAICANGRTISERKVMTALVSHLETHLSSPDRVERFVAAFKARFAAQARPDDQRVGLENQLTRQEALVGNILQALVAVPGSPALAAKLAAEEATLQRLRTELAALTPTAQRVLPHPAAIAAFVGNLQKLIAENPLAAAKVLRRALTPFRISYVGEGKWRLSGALDTSVCDSKSSGGVLPLESHSRLPLELQAA